MGIAGQGEIAVPNSNQPVFDIGAFTTKLIERQDRQNEIALENGKATAEAIGRNTVIASQAADSAASAAEAIKQYSLMWAKGLAKIDEHEVKLEEHDTRLKKIEDGVNKGKTIWEFGGGLGKLLIAIAAVVAAYFYLVQAFVPSAPSPLGIDTNARAKNIERKLEEIDEER